MKRFILSFCVAVSILLCNGSYANAAAVSQTEARAVLILEETHYSPTSKVWLRVEIQIQDSTSQINSCRVTGTGCVTAVSSMSYGSFEYSSDRKHVVLCQDLVQVKMRNFSPF